MAHTVGHRVEPREGWERVASDFKDLVQICGLTLGVSGLRDDRFWLLTDSFLSCPWVSKEVSPFPFVIDFGATGLAVRKRGEVEPGIPKIRLSGPPLFAL